MNVFRIQAMMTLSDQISGPLASIRASFQATGAEADRLAGKIAGLARQFAPFVVSANMLAGSMTFVALAIEDVSRSLQKLASTGIQALDSFQAKVTELAEQISAAAVPAIMSASSTVGTALIKLGSNAQVVLTGIASGLSNMIGTAFSQVTALIGKASSALGDATKSIVLSDIESAEQMFFTLSNTVKNFISTVAALTQSLINTGEFSVFSRAGSEIAVAFQQIGNTLDIVRGKLLAFNDVLMLGRNTVLEIVQVIHGQVIVAFETLQQRIIDISQTINSILIPSIVKANEIMSSLGLAFVQTSVGFDPMTIISWIDTIVSGVIKTISFIKALTDLENIIPKVQGYISTATNYFNKFKNALPAIITAVRGYATTMWSVASAHLAAYWPIYAVIGVIGLLVVAFKTNFLGIGDTLRSWYNNVKLIFEGVFALLSGKDVTSGALGEKLQAGGLMDTVVSLADALKPAWTMITNAIDRVKTAFDDLKTSVQPLISLIGSIALPIFKVLAFIVGITIVNAISQLEVMVRGVSLVFKILVAILGFLFNVIHAVWDAIMSINWQGIIESIGSTVMGVFENISGLITSIMDFIGSFSLFDAGKKLWETFTNGIMAFISAPVDAVKSVMGRIGDLFPHSDAKEGPLSQLTNSGRSLLDTFGEGVRSATPALRSTIGIALAAGTIPLHAEAELSPQSVQVEPLVVTSTQVEIAAPATVQPVIAAPIPFEQVPVSDWQAYEPTPMPDPVGQEITHTHIHEIKERESFVQPRESRRYSITINTLNLPKVTDAQSFVDELSSYIDGHDGGN